MMKYTLILLYTPLFLFILSLDVSAQRKKRERILIEKSPKQELVYDNINYLPQIKSVQFYPTGKEGHLPIYTLGTNEQLFLSFDDLRADNRVYYFSLEHCNADWNPSRVSPLDYAEGYNEDRIDNYQQSQGTYQSYTHYQLIFPNEYIRPKIAGNYILKIYEDADKSRLVISRKFYVVRPLINVQTTIQPSSITEKRQRNQKLNVTINSSALTIANPHRDLRVHVFQNQRYDYNMVLTNPMFIGNNEIKYNNMETLDFLGNNEFRFVDLRSLRAPSGQVSSIVTDSIYSAKLYLDEDNSNTTYGSTFDENGRFYIRNLDFDNADTQADYADVLFSLKTKPDVKGDIYVVGGFNNFQRSQENKLTYNTNSGNWEVVVKLKQGLYDYEYILATENEVKTDAFSGSFYETGNDYQVLVYFRRIGTYWDEILGVGNISINNKGNRN